MTSTATDFHWPDRIDGTVTLLYVLLILGVMVAGYACMVIDYRASLRSLRRALVLITHYRMDLPAWVLKDTPPCIRGLGLKLPCTVDDVLCAYREKVKLLHPDRGGDRRKFLRLQEQFEQAVALLEKE